MEEKISLRKAINYFWSNDKKWTVMLSWIAIFIGFFIAVVILEIPMLIPIIGVFFMCLIIPFIFILEFAGLFYFVGYVYEVIENTIQGKAVLPEVFKADHKARMKSGAPYMLIGFVYYLPTIVFASIFYFVLIFIIIGVSSASGNNDSFALVIILLLSAIAGLVMMVISVLNKFAVDSAMYRYIKTKVLARAFDFGIVKELVVKGMKEHLAKFWRMLLIGFCMMLFALLCYSPFIFMSLLTGDNKNETEPVFGPLFFLFCCLYVVGIIVYYLVMIPIYLYIQPNLTGQMYRIWDKKGFNKI